MMQQPTTPAQLLDSQGRTIEYLRTRQRAYRQQFLSPGGQELLADLAKFCRAGKSCFDPDPRLHAVAEGRREVWLRIQDHLNLSTRELYELLSGRTFIPDNAEENDE